MNYCHRRDRILITVHTGCEVFLSQFIAEPWLGLREGVGLAPGDMAGKQQHTLGLAGTHRSHSICLGLLPSLIALSKLKPGPSLQPRQLPPSLTHWERALFFFTPQSQFLTFKTPPSLSSLHLPLP